MARANPRFNRLNLYFKEEFPWQNNLYIQDVFTKRDLYNFWCKFILYKKDSKVLWLIFIKEFTVEFSYKEVKNILKELKEKELKLFRVYQYMWLSYQKRIKKSEALYCDSSTFKRTCDKACIFILKKLFKLKKYD